MHHLTITLKVAYDLYSATPQEVEAQARKAIETTVNVGDLTVGTDADIAQWDLEIQPSPLNEPA